MWAEMVISKYKCNHMYVIICHSIFTSCYPQYSHDPDDGGVDGERGIDLNLFQGDAHHWQQHNGQIQLVPPTHTDTHNDFTTYRKNPNPTE